MDVLGCVLWMTRDLNGAELIVNPGPSDATAKRAVAVRRDGGSGWQLQLDRAAVARALVHLVFALRRVVIGGGLSCEA